MQRHIIVEMVLGDLFQNEELLPSAELVVSYLLYVASKPKFYSLTLTLHDTMFCERSLLYCRTLSRVYNRPDWPWIFELRVMIE
jgi:hypothetical protein